MDKKAVAQAMVNLQNSLIEGQLALMFEYLDELEALAGTEYMMKVLSTLARSLPDSFLVKEYIEPILREHPEEYETFFGVEVDGGEK
ncbi:hypothetical protein EYB33_19840 [Lysinibacillus sphaericus]|uniref:hypothetical protein n=1 Tax=Lysinibacillus sphaericus TaxID=1421 RepID=UPI001E2CC0CA|nr:hypothetical protein [Lysinibacillus sphaericus]UDK98380.1 hypothetical protein EYB33_19840 [Lysinibacillus sphaericus]